MPNKKMIFTVLTVFTIMNVFIFAHLNFFLNGYMPTSIILILHICFAGVIVLSMFPIPKSFGVLHGRVFKRIGGMCIGIFAVALQSLVVFDVVSIIVNSVGDPTDRFYQISGIMIFVAVVVMTLLGIRNASKTVIQKFSIEVDKKNTEVDSLKLLLVSDIHLGAIIGNKQLSKLVAMINEQNPDAVLIAGDTLDGDYDPIEKENMIAQFSKVNPAIEVFGALGNHDYYGKKALQFTNDMERVGVKMLLDESRDFKGVQIVGRHDIAVRNYIKPRMEMNELVAGLDHSKAVIVIDHKPEDYENANSSNVDVIVSGHTHRGQIAPVHLVTRKLFVNDWGYKKLGSLHTFVTAGFGTHGPRMRLRSNSEIFEIELKFRK